jgi:hypothetical protein
MASEWQAKALGENKELQGLLEEARKELKEMNNKY